ncbi:hypothetical protein QFC22_004905 [Naganishia vaughanmartiniae]|uniref:Uncharacterized protein n=1 Tax=Naganishia vaughanmartiniae TaxID=1424756 RepID=A0ACC2WYA7_9TREE|nr:hypothetical protein QFC22_004905 [Naganishia vaughanmartiniae]
MSTQEELEELFAFLDQLELQEKLELQSSTSTADTSVDSAPRPVSMVQPTKLNLELTPAESSKPSSPPKDLVTKADVLDNSFQLHEGADDDGESDMLSPRRKKLASQEGKENEIPNASMAIVTPPRRRAVQFNVITPLKTPQRRAPKLIFTPMRNIQSAVQPVHKVLSTTPMKPAIADEATIQERPPILDGAPVPHLYNYQQRLPSPNATQICDRPVLDSDEGITPTSINPSNSPLAVEDILGNDNESIVFDSALSPTPHASRSVARVKKRVIYSSEDDSDNPSSTTLAQRPALAAAASCEEEIEFVGEKPSHTVIQVKPALKKTLPAAKTTKHQAGRREVAKFIDDMASAAGRYNDEDSSEDDRDLEGFVVDDDYIEYEKDSAEDNSEGSDYVLRYSPTTPKLTKTAQTKVILNVDLTETSDEDIPASPTLLQRPRPKPRPRHTSAKSLETPQKNRSEKRAWDESKQKLAQTIMDDLDSLVFEGKLVKEWGVRAVWNNKLLTTAGRAHHKRVKLPDGTLGHDGRIELSEKVLDDEDKLKNTVAHEMCHLASWIISGEMKNPHGAVFKSWGKKVMKARKDIEVTTKHSYVIAYKVIDYFVVSLHITDVGSQQYEWECTTEGCGAIYRRHSKSIDIERKGCGKCRGKLRPLFKTRGAGAGSTPFQDFLKQNMKLAKAAMPKATHGDVMRALSERWKATGGAKSPAEIVLAGEDPLAVQRQHAEHWQGLALGMQGLSII